MSVLPADPRNPGNPTDPTPQALVEPARSPRYEARPAPAEGAGPAATGLDVLERASRPRRGGRGPRGVSPRPGHIPGLDGLRALAVAAVLVYHFVPSALPGGFLGVDIFFVVSGFLITTLLLRELDQRGRVDLPAFWKRRARRLVPALVLVVLVSVTAARLVGGDLLVGIGRQTLGALTFTTNWLEIAAGASYFHSTSPILFVNFWSLAVEEQFYLLWPLALVLGLALTRTTRQRLLVVGGIGLASAVAMAVLHTPGTDATRVYYGTDTHLVGLMAGAVLALAWADPGTRAGLRSPAWRRWRGAALLGALALLGSLMLWMGESSALTFRGGIALASLATVVLIAALLESPSPWRRLMEARPLRWLGERSYGIYLWHWPVLVIASALVPHAPGTLRGALVLLVALAITLVAAEASLRLVERPVRRHGFRASLGALLPWLRTPWHVSRTPRIAAGIAALLVVLTGVALATAPEKSSTQQQIEDVEARLVEGTLADAVEGGTDAAEAGSELGLAGAEASSEVDAKDEAKDDGKDDGVEALPPEAEVNGSTFTRDASGLLVPDGDEMTAIGDSLVVTSADGLTYRFPGISYVAKSNRQWRDLDLIEEAVADGKVADNVVLHLGTNAGVDADSLRSLLETLGPERNVVVMNLYLRATFTERSNDIIDTVVAEHPNAVVGDWNAAARARPEVLQADQTHPDIEGMHVYAEVVATAFAELARRSLQR